MEALPMSLKSPCTCFMEKSQRGDPWDRAGLQIFVVVGLCF